MGANSRIGKVVGDSFHFCLSQCGSSLSPSVAFAGCTVVSLALSFLLECVSSLSLLSFGRLRWLYYCFLGLSVGFA